ncbi:LysR family transcriptional regulator [Bordetella petrii]|nr:LysR family transcriptional regulator [Bordetella petrii]
MSITFKQVEAFLAVARTLSFSQAAELVHLSQPALSANIRRLEEALGARLFDRDTRTVTLSAVGREFQDIAAGLHDHVEQGLARMQEIVAGKHGQLNIATAPSVAASSLPDILMRYKAVYPGIQIRIYDELSNTCAEMVRSGMADIALMPQRTDADDLAQQVVFRDPLVVLCAVDHPLAARSNVGWADIIESDLVVRSHDSSVRQLIDAKYLQHGAILRPAYEVNHVLTALGLIAAGLGIGVMPSSILSSVNMAGMTCRHFDPARTPYWTICLTRPKTRSSPPAVESFVRMCLEHWRAGAAA